VTDDELDKAFLELVEGGELDRILRQLRHKWNGAPRETVLNAVRDAATELVQRAKSGQKITNVPGLIRTIADRQLIRGWEDIEAADGARGAIELQATHPEIWRHDETRVAKIERAADYVRTLVPKIESESYRATLYAMLDAAVDGHQLQPKQLAEQMGCSPNTASKWMERAPQRLLPFMEDAGYTSFEELLNMTAPQHSDDDTDQDEELDDD
jgi:DNA-directed RNA polymerase specialized sigma24 family protein